MCLQTEVGHRSVVSRRWPSEGNMTAHHSLKLEVIASSLRSDQVLLPGEYNGLNTAAISPYSGKS